MVKHFKLKIRRPKPSGIDPEFLEFFAGDFTDLLRGDWEIPGASPHPHGGPATSWDRRAAYLLWLSIKGRPLPLA